MATQSDKPLSSEGDGEEFVPAVVARSETEAEEYAELLSDHDIPAVVGDEEDVPKENSAARRISRGVPVLVPEALLDEASEVIADREDLTPFSEDEEDEDEEGEGFGFGEEEEDGARAAFEGGDDEDVLGLEDEEDDEEDVEDEDDDEI